MGGQGVVAGPQVGVEVGQPVGVVDLTAAVHPVGEGAPLSCTYSGGVVVVARQPDEAVCRGPPGSTAQPLEVGVSAASTKATSGEPGQGDGEGGRPGSWRTW